MYDANVSLASIHGANRAYIEQEIPHIASIMQPSIEEVLARSEVIVIGNADPAFRTAVDRLSTEQRVIDLVRTVSDGERPPGYEGVAW